MSTSNESPKKPEEISFQNEELYKLLIKGVKDYAIFMLDTTGHIVTWNAGAERIKGYKAHEIIGKHFSTFYLPDAVQSKYPQFELQKALEDGKFEDEGWRVRKDGSLIWANVLITTLYDKQGKHLGFSKITRDLSERRKNEELMLKNRELLRINTDLDNFIYTASHDLKAPVINLEGLVEVLKEEIEDNRHDEVLERITNSINRLKTVIYDLTEVARLQDNSLEKEPVSFQDLLEEIQEDLQVMIQKSGARITADFNDYLITQYPRKNLRSILYNLLSNAIKYATPNKAPEISLKLEELPNKTLRFTIADNGLGMSEVQKQKVFSMYKRMHTHVEGSGLGLYIVKRILENNGDRIEVESEVDKGSVFSIYFSTYTVK
ncbi:PAS domain-containing sensor histidine kinase [Pontibacter sp. H259]|uniref:PAS domain-containing sensor histidine kinase n=1 Tax=Pontibacter sp. H259 TaxID=3133421 RepID=UPI0030BAD322